MPIVRSLFIMGVVFVWTAYAWGPIELTQEALSLHHASLLVDGHNDLAYQLRKHGDFSLAYYDLNKHQSKFHTDIPRLEKGGMGAQLFAAYVSCGNENNGIFYKKTLEQIDLIQRMSGKYAAFQKVLTSEDIRKAREENKIAVLISVEGGHSIENSLTKLNTLYKLGARSMTLTHGCTLDWADSATDVEKHGGLTDFGRDVVREMNDLGMVVDISHVSPNTMQDVLEVTTAPVIASHSSAYAVYSHARNVPDDVLTLIAANNGVVMVNFYASYLSLFGADVDTLLNHIDHIVNVAGIDHVGLGSDYDGVPKLPKQLEDVSTYPYITQGLMNRGYKDEEIKKILGENFMRVFSKVEKEALR